MEKNNSEIQNTADNTAPTQNAQRMIYVDGKAEPVKPYVTAQPTVPVFRIFDSSMWIATAMLFLAVALNAWIVSYAKKPGHEGGAWALTLSVPVGILIGVGFIFLLVLRCNEKFTQKYPFLKKYNIPAVLLGLVVVGIFLRSVYLLNK
jgi:hypothetical protein